MLQDFLYFVLSIIALIYACGSWTYMIEEVWDWVDVFYNFFVILTGACAIIWATACVSKWFAIFYLVLVIITSIILIVEGDYFSFYLIYSLIVGALLVFAFWGEVSEERAIVWDMENYEIQAVEYPVMGVSGDQIVIKMIDEEGNISLEAISMNCVEWKIEDVLVPYVYREKYIYTKYDYRKEPPEVLEKGNEKWSSYILYGTEKQIQNLLGYDANFQFEQ